MTQHPETQVLLAIFGGGLIKYAAVAAAVLAFPERFGPPPGAGET